MKKNDFLQNPPCRCNVIVGKRGHVIFTMRRKNVMVILKRKTHGTLIASPNYLSVHVWMQPHAVGCILICKSKHT